MSKINPKGILVAIGGSEDKGIEVEEDASIDKGKTFMVSGILKSITSLISSNNPRIEVFTTASAKPELMQETYKEAFGKLGFKVAGFYHMNSKVDADMMGVIDQIKKADCIFLTGGDQARLLEINKDSRFLNYLKKLYYNKRIVIAGTSAGAMVMSDLTITQNKENGSEGSINIIPGFSFIKNVIIDTHFASRGRYWRLAEAVAQNPGCLGIGMDEDTAVSVRDGRLLEVIGSGLVSIIEGRNITSHFSSKRNSDETLTIENLVTHILSRGDGFDLYDRKVYVKAYLSQDGESSWNAKLSH
ncbi:MAG: cyanophycinase [Balneolales bacterium]